MKKNFATVTMIQVIITIVYLIQMWRMSILLCRFRLGGGIYGEINNK